MMRDMSEVKEAIATATNKLNYSFGTTKWRIFTYTPVIQKEEGEDKFIYFENVSSPLFIIVEKVEVINAGNEYVVYIHPIKENALQIKKYLKAHKNANKMLVFDNRVLSINSFIDDNSGSIFARLQGENMANEVKSILASQLFQISPATTPLRLKAK